LLVLMLFRPFIWLLPVLLLQVWLPATVQGAEKLQERKVVVVVIDKTGWSDLFNGQAPRLEKLASHGAVGLMNVRPKELFNANPASSYLSMGMGVRAVAPGSPVIIHKDNFWQVESLEKVRTMAREKTPNYQVGMLGRTAREQGLKVAVLSRGLNPAIGLLAMDEKGKIPLGYLESAKEGAEVSLLGKTVEFLSQADLLFIDYGDASRVREADEFIGQLVNKVDLARTLILVISPNASKTMLEEDLNPGLTPLVVIGGWARPGLLVSETTRREGIVSALDLAPTILSFLNAETKGWVGQQIMVKPGSGGVVKTAALERFIVNINKTRYLLHGIEILLISTGLGLIFIRKRAGYRGLGTETVVLTALTLPLVSMGAGLVTDYSHYILAAFGILALSAILAAVGRYLWGDFLWAAGSLALLTAIAILAGSLINLEWLLRSPFGYNDLIIGGRYYGLNNDIMGILLGAAGLGLFAIGQRVNLSRFMMGLAILVLFGGAVVALSPFFGSNVGGSMTALAMLFSGLWMVGGGRLNLLSVGAVVLLVVLAQMGIAALDVQFNSSITHAGRAVQSLAEGGTVKFIEIVGSKLSQVMLMLVIPPWNLVLVALIAALVWIRWRKGEALAVFQAGNPLLSQGFGLLSVGSLVVFLFNDTGVISAALMLTNLVLPLGVMLPGQIVRPTLPVREWVFTGKDIKG